MPIQPSGMRVLHKKLPGRNPKYSATTLKPVRMWLRKQLGRPWDKVYSELTQALQKKKYQEVKSWISSTVLQTIWMKDGKPYEPASHCWNKTHDGWIQVTGSYYVNPNTGLLCWAPGIARNHYKEQYPEAYKDPDDVLVQYHEFDGLWYKITFRPPTDEEIKHGEWGHWGYVNLPGEDTIYIREVPPEYVRWITKPPKVINMKRMWKYKVGYTYMETCKFLFGEALFPIKKQQVSGEFVKKMKKFEKVHK